MASHTKKCTVNPQSIIATHVVVPQLLFIFSGLQKSPV